jgi:hypothetical protein
MREMRLLPYSMRTNGETQGDAILVQTAAGQNMLVDADEDRDYRSF